MCYADDCTYSSSHVDPVILQKNIKVGFNKISKYMTNNKLFINSDKTHILVMNSEKSHSLHSDFDIKLDTGSEIIELSPEERLLEANVTNDFLWRNHLRDHKKSVINILKTKINALSILCHFSSFFVRKMFANGLVLSHLLYHIELYGGCTEELLSALQIQQNRAARLVCRLPWRTSIKTLLKQMGWMSVRQMVAYYSIMSCFKAQQSEQPKYIHKMFSTPFTVKTRLADSGGIWDPRRLSSRNGMPESIRTEKAPIIFATKLRVWIKDNVLLN